MIRPRSRFCTVLLLAFALILPGVLRPLSAADDLEFPLRAIWVSRFNWRSPESIEPIMANIADLGLNAVIWQARGGGTVLYHSEVEAMDPRLEGMEDDPLQLAIDAARAHGLKFHVWINTMPGWSGTRPPEDPEQLWNAHPEWFMAPRETSIPGLVQPGQPELQSGYSFLDPTHPGVQEHVAAIVRELAEKYDVDGIHFDYIRYPGPDYGYGAETIARFGSDPRMRVGDWNEWRRSQLTALLRGAVEPIRESHPGLLFSAATWGNYEDGLHRFLQDQHDWLAQGLLDFTCPMAYTTDPASFELLATEHLANQRRRKTALGIGLYLFPGDAEILERELRILAEGDADGFVIYDYGSLFEERSAAQREFLKRNFGDSKTKPPVWPWVEKRLAGSKDTVGPFLDQLMSDSPLFEIDKPHRVGVLAKDATKIEGSPTLHVAGPLEPVMMEGQTFVMRPLNVSQDGKQGIYVSPPVAGFEGPDDIRTLFALALDVVPEGREPNVGVSEKRVVRPVSSESLNVARAFVGLPMEGAQYPLFVPGSGIWISAESEDAVYAYDRRGRSKPFSPLTAGLDAAGSEVKIRAPSSLELDGDGNILLLAENADKSLVLRYSAEGQARPGFALDIYASTMTLDAEGRIFAPEAYRRRWHVFNREGERLAGPFSPHEEGTYGREAPSLYRGIAVSQDGSRVYVGNPTNRRVDVYKRNGEGLDYSFVDEPLCRLGGRSGAIDVAPDGRIFISDSDHFIRVFSPDGKQWLGDVWSDSPVVRHPRGVAFIPGSEDFYVGMHGGGEFIGRLVLFQPHGLVEERMEDAEQPAEQTKPEPSATLEQSE